MNILNTLTSAALLLSSAGFCFAQNNYDNATISSTHVSGNVYMLELDGGGAGNIAISLGDDGVLMVDDQFAPLAVKIQAAIADIGGDAPRFLLNTHWHGDHTGGNQEFSNEAIIIAQDNVRVRLSDPASGREPEAFPVITYANSLSVHFNGEEITATHLANGHTDGDSVIWFKESNVLHMGDEFFAGAFPFVDITSGGSVIGLIRNLNTMLAQIPEDIMIIPGHGELSTKGQFTNYINGVKETSKIVIDQIYAGASLDEILAAGLPPQYDSWGLGFISEPDWITSIYESVTH